MGSPWQLRPDAVHIWGNRFENLTFSYTGHKRQLIVPFVSKLQPALRTKNLTADFIQQLLIFCLRWLQNDSRLLQKRQKHSENSVETGVQARAGILMKCYLKAHCAFLPLRPSSWSHSNSPVKLSQAAVYTVRTAGEEVNTVFCT